jgi:hypothetical protein
MGSNPVRTNKKDGNSLIGKILYCDYKDMGSIPIFHPLLTRLAQLVERWPSKP